MSRYGSVTITGPTSLITRIVQSASPDDLQTRAQAAIDALPAGYVVVAITLAGAGDGHTFTVTIEAGDEDDTEGGFDGTPQLTCYLASAAEALLVQRANVAPASGNYVDTQVAGSSQGTRFMGMLVRGTLPAGGASAIVQVGYDETVEVSELLAGGALYPRNAANDPLRVVLPGVVPGNVLEVDWKATISNAEADLALPEVVVRAVISWDGTTAFPGTFQFLINCANNVFVPRVADTLPGVLEISARSAITIPVGATTATVELFYDQDAEGLLTGGTELDPGAHSSLRVTELLAAAVAQVGPATLVPLIP